MGFFTKDIGIDLGTATVLIYVKGKGIVLREPSVVSLDRDTGRVLKVGQEALDMLGRTPDNIVTLRPLQDGVISDYETTEKMLRYFIRKANGRSLIKPNVIVCVPSRINEVEERAVRDATRYAGARWVELIEEPMAAALGAGIDISKPRGVMVIDIGGGTADVAVISLNDVVVSESVKCGGDKFDDAIVRYVRREHNVIIGQRTAEDIKIKIGCLSPRPEKLTMTVRGRCVTTGLPKEVTISSPEVMSALLEPAKSIVEAVHDVLSKTAPELISDIAESGISLTGGGGLIYGFDQMISSRIGIPVHTEEDAVCCVVKGTGIALERIDSLRDAKVNFPEKRFL